MTAASTPTASMAASVSSHTSTRRDSSPNVHCNHGDGSCTCPSTTIALSTATPSATTSKPYRDRPTYGFNREGRVGAGGVVVVGGGLAGWTAAVAALEAGSDVTLVERARRRPAWGNSVI